MSSARLHQPAGDFASMIMLGRHSWMMPAVPAQVIAAFQDRGMIHVVPQVFRSGHRGQSSYLYPADGSDFSAFIPSFGPNPWAKSPEGLVAHLMEAGLSAVLVCAPPPREQTFKMMEGGPSAEPQAYVPAAMPAAAPSAPTTKPKAKAATDQMDLFGEVFA